MIDLATADTVMASARADGAVAGVSRTYVPALDGVRGIAIGIVLAAHAGVSWFQSGGVGVDLFFVLSGYLITDLLVAEHAREGRISWRGFYARRALRLVPALILTCVIVAVIVPRVFGSPPPWTEIGLTLSYTMNWVMAGGHELPWLGHAWSLALEEQFYLIWPWVVLALARGLATPRARAGWLAGVAVGVGIYRAVLVGTVSSERINYAFDTRIDTLLWGGVLAYLLRRTEGGMATGVSRALGWAGAPLALLCFIWVPHAFTWHSPWMGWIGYPAVALAAALIVGDAVAGRHSLLRPLLSVTPLRWVGRVSYGLYLLHMPAFVLVERFAPRGFAGLPTLKIAASVAAAALSYYLMERYFLKLKTRFGGSGLPH